MCSGSQHDAVSVEQGVHANHKMSSEQRFPRFGNICDDACRSVILSRWYMKKRTLNYRHDHPCRRMMLSWWHATIRTLLFLFTYLPLASTTHYLEFSAAYTQPDDTPTHPIRMRFLSVHYLRLRRNDIIPPTRSTPTRLYSVHYVGLWNNKVSTI